jgi:hypothetical protein
LTEADKTKAEAQIGRVRGLYIDFGGSGRTPLRGDRVSSGKSLYYVLHARKVRRRIQTNQERIQMCVIKRQDLPEGLSGRLIRSAIRGHGASYLFEFTWYPRKKKAQTFEQYMRRQS